jgi:hypothetical protein
MLVLKDAQILAYLGPHIFGVEILN